jgi:uncharacterized membrane protein YkoI
MMNGKQRKQTVRTALVACALGFGMFGGIYAADKGTTQPPAYQSSIKVPDQNNMERDEAARLASLAKIDVTQATAAAVGKVPGTPVKAVLDNENGNLVYSVEIKTASNEVKDVKVDAGNGAVLLVENDVEDED